MLTLGMRWKGFGGVVTYGFVEGWYTLTQGSLPEVT